LSRCCGRPLGVGFFAVPQMASPLSPSRRRQPAAALSRSALRARDALVLEHLPLAVAERFREAVAIASAMARRLFPLVEREDLI
jgi:RNA polymerase sigma-B factor